MKDEEQPKFATEAELVLTWRNEMARFKHDKDFTIYSETAGWDVLMVHTSGFQIGVEAKLSLNAHVLSQAIRGVHCYYSKEGPDYRGVLVPRAKCQLHLTDLAAAIGIGIIKFTVSPRYVSYCGSGLPDEKSYSYDEWPNWMPEKRCTLPEYVPDVAAGKPSPVALTEWKIKAIKLCIILERRGHVGRGDMNTLKISPSRWTDCYHGLLDRDPMLGYIRGKRTPDLRKVHPVNYAQIEADWPLWGAPNWPEL